MDMENTQQNQSGLQIVYRPLRDLVPYVRNARTHNKAQLGKLRASLKRFGWTNPMLIAGNEMIAGHGRLSAALALLDAHEAIPRNPDPASGPTVDLSHLSPTERRAYVLADNRIALDAGWDNDLLRIEFAGLKMDGFDLALTGFSKFEMNRHLGDPLSGERGLSDSLAYQVIVDCRDERHQAELIEQLRAQGLACKPLII
jgi:ParB-like chromosome segregation protein Spo0J